MVTLTTALSRYSIALSTTRIDLPILKKFSTIAKLTGTLFKTFSLLIPGILACLTILPLLPPSSLTQFNLVLIFLLHLPVNLAKGLLQSGLIHNIQQLSNIKTTALNNGNFTKLHIQELYLYKLITHAPKPSIMPKPPLSNASIITFASCQTGSRSFLSLAKVVLQNFCHSSFPSLKNNSAHLHALLPLKLTFLHQPLLSIPILMTNMSNLLSTPHPPLQCPLLRSLHEKSESPSSAQHLPI